MKLYLDTSTPLTVLKLDEKTFKREFGRDLSLHLLGFIHEQLISSQKDWQDLTELHFFTGPGSFTGLRIGATVINTLSNELGIPIYDQDGQSLKIVLPKYGRPANISKPKK